MAKKSTKEMKGCAQTTKMMRSKEEAHDYRYFPEPDLRPLVITEDMIADIQKNLPELPSQRFEKYVKSLGLSEQDAGVLVEFKELGDFLDATSAHTKNLKAAANWLMGDITGALKEQKLTLPETKLSPQNLAELVTLLDEEIISSAIAKKLLPEMLEAGASPKKLVEERGLAQVSDEGAIRAVIQKIMDENPKNVEDYRAGRDKLFGFFVGQAMKETKGSANPKVINDLLKQMLSP